MSRFVIGVVAIASVWVLVTEATMQPSQSERMALLGVFGMVAAGTLVAGWFLRSRARRLSSIRLTIQLVAMSAVLVVALGSAVASPMFIEVHDLRLMLVAVGLGVALGLTLALSVGGSVASDLAQIASAAKRVAEGDTTVATNVDRPDEIGDTARAVDAMVAELDASKRQRLRDEQGRRDFLAAVGHDLRTPLASMQVGLEALQDGYVDDEEAMIGRLLTNLRALETLVDDLAVLGRVEAGGVDPVSTDLAELADETIEGLTTIARAADVGVAVVATQPVVVSADRGAVGRLIRNLVDNAIRYAPPGSDVEVRVKQTGDAAQVEVVDEGPGFDPDFRDVAFDRFTTSDEARSGSGSGLGLAIARSVVDAHHGSIEIGKEAGGVVRFSLPINRTVAD